MSKILVFFVSFIICVVTLGVATNPASSEQASQLSGYAAILFGLLAVLLFIVAFSDEEKKLREDDKKY